MPPAVLPHQGTHTPWHQEVSHQFEEPLRSWTEAGNNAETPGNRREIHHLAVSLAGWLNHYLYIHPSGLPNHPC